MTQHRTAGSPKAPMSADETKSTRKRADDENPGEGEPKGAERKFAPGPANDAGPGSSGQHTLTGPSDKHSTHMPGTDHQPKK